MTANTPRSRKSKGAKFQREIKELLMETFTNLEEGDILSTTMGDSGADLKLSPAARRVFPFSVECKAQEKVSLRQWWEQAKANSTDELAPLLITKQSRKEPLVVMNLQTFIKLLTHD